MRAPAAIKTVRRRGLAGGWEAAAGDDEGDGAGDDDDEANDGAGDEAGDDEGDGAGEDDDEDHDGAGEDDDDAGEDDDEDHDGAGEDDDDDAGNEGDDDDGGEDDDAGNEGDDGGEDDDDDDDGSRGATGRPRNVPGADSFSPGDAAGGDSTPATPPTPAGGVAVRARASIPLRPMGPAANLSGGAAGAGARAASPAPAPDASTESADSTSPVRTSCDGGYDTSPISITSPDASWIDPPDEPGDASGITWCDGRRGTAASIAAANCSAEA
jgi:hypothetical protein